MKVWLVSLCVVALVSTCSRAGNAQAPERGIELLMSGSVFPSSTHRFVATEFSEVREWDSEISALIRVGDLRVRMIEEDTVIPGRQHERLSQYYRGVPVYGGEVVRELEAGLSLSLGGTIYHGIDVETAPSFSVNDVETLLVPRHGDRVLVSPSLVVFPMDEVTYLLAYVAVVFTSDWDVVKYFVDAHTGDVLKRVPMTQSQGGLIASGTGVHGDAKKISVTHELNRGVFVAEDSQRPAKIYTIDLGFNVERGLNVLFRGRALQKAWIASDLNNVWTDRVAVDAHAYMGWTYDYLYERFGRAGLDGKNRSLFALVHWLRPSDYYSLPESLRGRLCNAFYMPWADLIVLGDGLPSSVGKCGPLAASFDVMAHELAHGLTRWTSNLEYSDESGALNEAFSDIIGNSAEWFHADQGNGLPYPTNYRLGEQSIPGGIRDMGRPGLFSHPDHYGARWMPLYTRCGSYLCSPDNGWVHINSSIVNQAFYLAVEGGTNDTSNLSVQGIGRNNRGDIEHAFYRAFSYKLVSSSEMRHARYWTIHEAPTEAARDAIRSAWDSVGVNVNQEVVIDFPYSSRTSGSCRAGFDLLYEQRIRTGSTGITVSQWTNDVYSSPYTRGGNWSNNERITGTYKATAATFREFFGKSYISPYTTVSTRICWTSKGARGVFLRAQITGKHDTGETVTHYSGQQYAY